MRYGHLKPYLATFLASVDSMASLLFSLHISAIDLAYRTSLISSTSPYTRISTPVLHLSFCVTASLLYGGTGISTCYPSPTTSVLGLGPDLPWADEPSPGNLGLSTAVFLALLSLLIPAFSLLYSPPVLPLWLRPVHYAPLPLHIGTRSFGGVF